MHSSCEGTENILRQSEMSQTLVEHILLGSCLSYFVDINGKQLNRISFARWIFIILLISKVSHYSYANMQETLGCAKDFRGI